MSYADLKDKVFVITGAAAGMGQDVAVRLVQQGSRVGLIDRDQPTQTLEKIKEAGGEAVSFICDVKNSKAIDDAVRKIAEKFGRLDGAANMAGFVASHGLDKITDEDWDGLLGVNLNGVKNSIVSELHHMKGPGSIVNAASISGQMGNAYASAYATSKWAVIGLTKSAAQEVGPRGIRVNAVAPGFVHTALTRSIASKEELEKMYLKNIPLGRMADPEDIARVILFLLSEEARYITSSVLGSSEPDA
ncbi:hypothetical protein LTS17_002309 [Exophiala oligosperma]